MLCTLLEGDPPAETSTPPRRTASFESTPDEAGLEQKQDGDGTEGNGAQPTTDRSSAPPLATGEEQSRRDEKPEESRFNVLLGMLTIATMVDAEGEAASNWAAKSSGMGHDEHEKRDRKRSGMYAVFFLGRIRSNVLVLNTVNSCRHRDVLAKTTLFALYLLGLAWFNLQNGVVNTAKVIVRKYCHDWLRWQSPTVPSPRTSSWAGVV